MTRMKKIFDQYYCYLLLLYFPIYLGAFWMIEHYGPHKIHIIECALDQQIPFVEYFIVPYILWFFYIGIGGLYFLICEKESYLKLMYVGMIGMTVFILVSVMYPNGLMLRPRCFVRDNIFVEMTKMIYSIDTSTNVFPSIHVFNSLAMHAAVSNSKRLEKHKVVKAASLVLCILIILSTMFLKQHSVFDVISGIALFMACYEVVYNRPLQKIADTFAMYPAHRKVKYKGNFH